MAVALNHIGLTVTNIERSAQFYCSHFHFTRGGQYQLPGMKILLLHQGPMVIELMEKDDGLPPGNRTGGWDHIAFKVDDIDAACRELMAGNVQLIDEQPRMSVFGKRILFLAGPDGERIELIEP